MDPRDGIRRKCTECKNTFFVCQRCWRGQKYCCEHCRKSARKRKLKIYKKKYESSEKGTLSNRLRQKRFRKKQKSVTYHSSPKKKYPLFFPKIKVKNKKSLCSCCHKRIDNTLTLDDPPLFFSFHRWKERPNESMV